jgi:catechol 2,3-dioxygenase-like lactoylglutathione lyase family enzyme
MTHPVDPTELAPVAPEFFVPDVAAAVRFYTDVLGFQSHRVESDFAIVGVGQAILMFADQRTYGAMGGAAAATDKGLFIDIRIMVPDVDAYSQRCLDAGLDIVHSIANRPYGLRDFIVRDLNGFRLRFASPLT